MKYVVITGVSTGIGYDTCRLFVESGFHVFGSVRKNEDAKKIKETFSDLFTPVVFDVSDKTAIKNAAKQIKNILGNNSLNALINNAGIAVTGPVLHLTDEELKKQFETNVHGVLNVTRELLPFLKGKDPGRIINISSISGKKTFPFLGAYAASKFALEALSDALRLELMIYGIDVIVIEPGSAHSSIWDKAPEIDKYDNTDYKEPFRNIMNGLSKHLESIMPVTMVSDAIFKAVTAKKPKTRYLVVNNKITNWWIPKMLPDRMMDKIFAKMMGLK